MYRELSNLILYRDTRGDSILFRLGNIFEQFELGSASPEHLRTAIYVEVRRILEVATQYGFDENLWQNYLAYYIVMHENPFSFTYEKAGKQEGSVNLFAENDFAIFRRLFDFDFSAIEQALDIRCFSILCHYRAISKREQIYNKNVSERVRSLSRDIAATANGAETLEVVSRFYRDWGVGMFGLNRAFRLQYLDAELSLRPISNMDRVMLDDLVGYEAQKKALVENTEAFLAGKPANNVLLYGDSGTGKSTSIKAIVNRYYDRGLRMIEIYKHQFKDLSGVIAMIKNRNYRFIIYMDDLSFEENETEYKFLKAVIEGGVETKPDNLLIYATSNRRHLIRESFRDRNDAEYTGDLHHAETVEEKLSLFNRFGLAIGYFKPSRSEFDRIVLSLAEKHPTITLDEETLLQRAHAWELRHGGASGRTAQQFINHLAGNSPDHLDESKEGEA